MFELREAFQVFDYLFLFFANLSDLIFLQK